MNRTVVYIGDDIADISPDTIVSATFQLWNIGDLKSRNVSYTNRIKLPATQTNNLIYENANSLKSKTRKPYTLVKIKIVQNGVEIIQNGTGLLRQFSTTDGYFLEIYDSTIDFFDAIKGRYVDEINLGVYGPFDDTFIALYADSTSPVGCPVIDYGRMVAPIQSIDNDEFDGDLFLPWENNWHIL